MAQAVWLVTGLELERWPKHLTWASKEGQAVTCYWTWAREMAQAFDLSEWSSWSSNLLFDLSEQYGRSSLTCYWTWASKMAQAVWLFTGLERERLPKHLTWANKVAQAVICYLTWASNMAQTVGRFTGLERARWPKRFEFLLDLSEQYGPSSLTCYWTWTRKMSQEFDLSEYNGSSSNLLLDLSDRWPKHLTWASKVVQAVTCYLTWASKMAQAVGLVTGASKMAQTVWLFTGL